MRVVSEAEAIENLPALLRDPDGHAIVITDGESDLRAIVSMEDYAIIRRAKADKFLRAMREFGDDIRARAAEDGLTPEDLMKILDRKAS